MQNTMRAIKWFHTASETNWIDTLLHWLHQDSFHDCGHFKLETLRNSLLGLGFSGCKLEK